MTVFAAQAAVHTTAPANRTTPRGHLFLYFMEFLSSLNKAKPTELWQRECPDIYWPRLKAVFIKWKSEHPIFSRSDEAVTAWIEPHEARAQVT
jgi:hypothetical protein